MIAFLEGILQEINENSVVVNVQGVGYEIFIPQKIFSKLKPTSTEKFYIHTIYREDAQTLYGFLEPQDRNFFRLLIEKVSGIGPKLALALINNFSLEKLYEIILTSNIGQLSECPGIGKKTAQRILVELKDTLSKHSFASKTTGTTTAGSNIYREAIETLTALVYSNKQAEFAVGEASKQETTVKNLEKVVKKALAILSQTH